MSAIFNPSPTPTAPHTYSVGSLSYDKRSLIVLFGWLLWGDFAFNFFEQVFGKFMPLYLNDLHASNTLIGITTGSIAGAVNILFLPNISQWSDRLRTRWGRRIPLLVIMAPLTTASLLGVGFAPEIGSLLNGFLGSNFGPLISVTTLVLALICAFTIGYHLFNMILVNSYNWLLRDVVPEPYMARFLSWFRIVGNIAGIFFLWHVFPIMISHRKEVFISVSVFYLLAFGMLCWKVREGQYVEPDPPTPGSNILTRFGTYFRDCMSLPIYRNFFLAYVPIFMGSVCASPFVTLYARNILNLSMGDMGQFAAYNMIASSILLIPTGFLCDKLSTMKVVLFSVSTLAFVPLIAFMFANSRESFLAYSIWSAIPNVGWGLGSVALSMTLFPKRYFGQFSAGLNVFGCGGLIIGNYLTGLFMDMVNCNYRMIFLWTLGWHALAVIPFYLVYRDWKNYGGQRNYRPPIPGHLMHPAVNSQLAEVRSG